MCKQLVGKVLFDFADAAAHCGRFPVTTITPFMTVEGETRWIAGTNTAGLNTTAQVSIHTTAFPVLQVSFEPNRIALLRGVTAIGVLATDWSQFHSWRVERKTIAVMTVVTRDSVSSALEALRSVSSRCAWMLHMCFLVVQNILVLFYRTEKKMMKIK